MDECLEAKNPAHRAGLKTLKTILVVCHVPHDDDI